MPTTHLATPHDLNAIVDLINRAYLVESHFVSAPRIGEDAVMARIADQEMLVLRARDRVIATAHMAVKGDSGHLGLVSVEPTMQGQGLGKRIIALAEDLARSRGAVQMKLQVVNLREELPPFYRQLGYQETGTSVFDETKCTLLPVHFIDMAKKLVRHE